MALYHLCLSLPVLLLLSTAAARPLLPLPTSTLISKDPSPSPSPSSLRFALLGDWGGQSSPPFTTPTQLSVSAAMARVAAVEEWRFVMALGDNFYETGIEGSAEEEETRRRFEATFEEVYDSEHLTSIPWWVVAGNHDYHGNVSAQVAYSSHSKRWNYPRPYYKLHYNIPNTNKSTKNATIDFFMTDTILWASVDSEAGVSCSDVGLEGIDGDDDDNHHHHHHHKYGPGSSVSSEACHDQIRWLRDHLKKSDADWLVVVGHYPIHSIAEHGPTSTLVRELKPMLEEFGVAAYVSGHDHNMQHLREEGADVDYVLQGAGHDVSPARTHEEDVPEGALKMFYAEEGGFSVMDVEEDEMRVRYINVRGETVYEFSKSNPRANRVASS